MLIISRINGIVKHSDECDGQSSREATLVSILLDYSTVEFSVTEQLAGFQSLRK